MSLYYRESNGYQIAWDPDRHRDLATQAVEEIIGETGESISDSKAQQVRQRWQELIEQNTSGSTA